MRVSRPLVLSSVCLLDLVTASPTRGCGHQPAGCNVTRDKIPLPTRQTALTIPNDTRPVFITAGFGAQNYSCSSTGTYTSVGAIAALFDASCAFDAFQSACNNMKSTSPEETQASMRASLGPNPLPLGHHYFVKNPIPNATGISPVFDFRADSRKGNPDTFVITSKIGDIPSPVNPTTNVDWLELQAIKLHGSLAKYVFRIFTIGGQPPSLCTPGSAPIAVPYAASYWFFT